MPLKVRIVAVAFGLLSGMQIQSAAASAVATDDYMGHCSDSEAYTPHEVISACENFIDHVYKENWKGEYLPEAYYAMGVARRRLGDIKAAEKYFGLAIARVPGYFAPWRQLVELMTGLSGNDSSLKAIDLMMARYPHDGHVLNVACWEMATMNVRLDTALADCNESLRIAPGEAGTLKSRGFVEYRLANYPASISDSTAALAVKPNDAAALYVRGLAKLKSGQTADGGTDIAAAGAIDADIAATFAKYGATP